MWILDLYLMGAIASGMTVLMDVTGFKKMVAEPDSGPYQHRPFVTAMCLMWLWPILIGITLWKILTGGGPSTRR